MVQSIVLLYVKLAIKSLQQHPIVQMKISILKCTVIRTRHFLVTCYLVYKKKQGKETTRAQIIVYSVEMLKALLFFDKWNNIFNKPFICKA